MLRLSYVTAQKKVKLLKHSKLDIIQTGSLIIVCACVIGDSGLPDV